MCEDNSFFSDYLKIWNDFVSSLKEFKTNVEKCINTNESLNIHQILKKIYDIPKIEMINYLKDTQYSQKSSPNPGAFTGIFFENILGIFIEPYIKKRVSPVQIERNYCDDENIKRIKRDPDFYLKSNNNRAIIEVKVAPKKNDLISIIQIRNRYVLQNINYYFIGGWVSASKGYLDELSSNGWISILEGSKTNMDIIENKFKKVDDLLDNICEHLNK